MNGKLIGLLFLTAAWCTAFSQEDAHYRYKGNQFYHNGNFERASAEYAKAVEADRNNKVNHYNLGTALYKDAMLIKTNRIVDPANPKVSPDSIAAKIFDRAIDNFDVVANTISNKDTLHLAWHNIGNCHLQKKDYRQAVDAYKKALKYNPKDEETRYNLAYALKHLPKQQGGGGGSSKDQQKKDQQQQQQPKDQIDQQQAEQLLKTMMQAERKLQDKRKMKPNDPSTVKPQKDW